MNPSEPPSQPDAPTIRSLAVKVDRLARDVDDITAPLRADLARGVGEVNNRVRQIHETELGRVNEILMDIDAVAAPACERCIIRLNEGLAGLWSWLFHAGADIPLDDFPGGIAPPDPLPPKRPGRPPKNPPESNPPLPVVEKPPSTVIVQPILQQPLNPLPVPIPLAPRPIPFFPPPDPAPQPLPVPPQSPRPPGRPPGGPGDRPPPPRPGSPPRGPGGNQTGELIDDDGPPQSPPGAGGGPLPQDPGEGQEGEPEGSPAPGNCPPPVVNVTCPGATVQVSTAPPPQSTPPPQAALISSGVLQPQSVSMDVDVFQTFLAGVPAVAVAGGPAGRAGAAAEASAEVKIVQATAFPVLAYQRIRRDGFDELESERQCHKIVSLRETFVALGRAAVGKEIWAAESVIGGLYKLLTVAFPDWSYKTRVIARAFTAGGLDDMAAELKRLEARGHSGPEIPRIVASPQIRKLMKEWQAAFMTLDREAYQEAAYLEAAVSVLELLHSYAASITEAVGIGFTVQSKQDRDLSLSSPLRGITGLGFGIGGSGQEGRSIEDRETVDLHATCQAVLLPMLDLARFFRDRANNPSIPTAAELMASFLRGGMSRSNYDCLMRAIGHDPKLFDPVLWANRTGLTVGDYTSAHRRGLIDDDTYGRLVRQSGVLDPIDAGLAYSLSTYIPGPSDLIRMMVRDVMDTTIVDRFKLDAEFDQKWKGSLAAKGFAQGIEPELARLFWRAHWDLPGMHQVYTMLHRLRPELQWVKDAGIETTEADVEHLLAQNDTLPFWRKRLIAISYHPLTRVDAQRMYMAGVLDRKGIVDAFLDIGYNPQRAENLADFTQRRREDSLIRHKAARTFVAGGSSLRQMQEAMSPLRLSQAEKDWLAGVLRREISVRTNKACVKAVRQQYLTGRWSDEDATRELISRDIPQEHVAELIRGFRCERASVERTIPAQTLCRWYSLGLLNEQEFKLRLVRLNYTAVDAARIVQHCKGTTALAVKKQKLREVEQVRKELDRLETKRKTREEQDAARIRRAERAANREAAAEARRKDKLRKSAEKLAGILADDPTGVAAVFQVEVAFLMSEYGLTQVEAEGIILHAAKGYDQQTDGTFRQLVTRLAEMEEVFDSSPGDVRPPPSE